MTKLGMALMNTTKNPDQFMSETTFATEEGVRAFLLTLPDLLTRMGIEKSCWGRIELVFAEVLNNIAEHAYVGLDVGSVEMTGETDGMPLTMDIRDQGHPMPGLSLPAGECPSHDSPLDSLPEGGFGWFLIKSLTENLNYTRLDEGNHLTFQIPLEAQ